MKQLNILIITVLMSFGPLIAQDAYVSPDSLERLQEFIEGAFPKAEKPVRIIGDESTVYAGKAIQAYSAQHMVTKDLINLFKEVNQEVKVFDDINNNRLILSGAPEEIDFALQQLEVLDEEQKMITVEFMLVEYFHADEFEWGIDITNGTTGNFKDGRFSPAAKEGVIEFSYNSIAKLVPQFHLNVQALVNDDKAKIVTNPHIAVQAGEKANINLKDERTIQLETATINGITTTLQNISAGIELDVEPTMINDDLIKIKMKGFVSEFLPFTASGEFLRESNTINTVVDVKPGETLIIGGMIKEEYNTLNGGVPFLKNIPVLGYLFTRKRKIKTYIERVLYITPHVNSDNSSIEHYKKLRDKTTLEKDISTLIEEDPGFIKYDKTKKAYKRRKKRQRKNKNQ